MKGEPPQIQFRMLAYCWGAEVSDLIPRSFVDEVKQFKKEHPNLVGDFICGLQAEIIKQLPEPYAKQYSDTDIDYYADQLNANATRPVKEYETWKYQASQLILRLADNVEAVKQPPGVPPNPV